MEELQLKLKPVRNPVLEERIQARLDDLTKPPGSLGRLEDLVMQYCLCRKDENAGLNSMKIFTFAGDHGITEEGVSPFPQEVTVQMVANMAGGGAAISVLCAKAGIDYSVVDIGVKSDVPEMKNVLLKKVARGTRNFAKEPAMSREEARAALKVGIDCAAESEYDLLGVGEMGIGNTSSSSALYSLLLNVPASETTGAGTGAAGELLARKTEVIERSVAFHRGEWDGSGFDALCRLGGFEIAGMAGVMLGGADRGIPVVVDGFISTAAALVAMRMEPAVQDYLIFSHASAEKFHRDFFRRLDIEPVMDLKMRLGEGTGAALAMHIVWQAMNCYHGMATFSSAGVSQSDNETRVK
jgi:nicotinate-nucleotide--dimethylbenzimidazole phosphoribosyltransferase